MGKAIFSKFLSLAVAETNLQQSFSYRLSRYNSANAIVHRHRTFTPTLC